MAEYPETAGELNIVTKVGTTFNLPLTWKDENGVVIDITGYSAAMQIRDSINDTGTPLLSLTDGSGITLGGAAGTIDIVISKTQNNFGQKTLFYDLIMTDTLGQDTMLIKGTFTSKPKVTK